MINVTKAYLPSFEKYSGYLRKIWDSAWLTNNGPLVQELEERLKKYLGVKYCYFCTNGTIALQIALRALDMKGEIITTPFSYVATTDAIEWEQCKAVFADIRDSDFNIDPARINDMITDKTSGIMAVHVYGNPVDVTAVSGIASAKGLKVIYDAAHAFGVQYGGRSLLSYGDVATCSLHATKLFHSCEGGLMITNDDEVARRLYLMRQFGHVMDDYYSIGTNAKNSELHAAMGLCVLDDIDYILAARKEVAGWYDELLNFRKLKKPLPLPGTQENHGYYPIVFSDEETLLKVKELLVAREIVPRRYFYPSLNELPYFTYRSCPVSESVSRRVLSLPLYPGLPRETVGLIAGVVNSVVS